MVVKDPAVMSLTVITTGHVFASILFCYLYAVHFRSKVTALNRSDANPARVNPVYMGKKCDFAKDWWAAEDQLSLEFRAVLSKVWKPSESELIGFIMTVSCVP